MTPEGMGGRGSTSASPMSCGPGTRTNGQFLARSGNSAITSANAEKLSGQLVHLRRARAAPCHAMQGMSRRNHRR